VYKLVKNMNIKKYKKYKLYNLLLIPIIVVLWIISERKDDIFFLLSMILLFGVMIFGNWLEFAKNKELNLPISIINAIGFWFPLIVGVPYILLLLIRLKVSTP